MLVDSARPRRRRFEPALTVDTMKLLEPARIVSSWPLRAIGAATLLLTCAALLGGCKQKREERIDLTQFIEVDPGRSIIDLSKKNATIRVSVRNVSHLELEKLRLTVKSEACAAVVTPRQVSTVLPGLRTAFKVTLTRNAGVAKRRYPLHLTLGADGLPVDAGVDLLVDLRGPQTGGWIDVGQVKIVHRKSSRTSYYLLGLLPLLFFVGFLLHRVGKRRDKKKR
jgi:hypothetical protein